MKEVDAAALHIWRAVCGMNRSQNRDLLFDQVKNLYDLTYGEIFLIATRMEDRGWVEMTQGRRRVWWVKPTQLGKDRWRKRMERHRRRPRAAP